MTFIPGQRVRDRKKRDVVGVIDQPPDRWSHCVIVRWPDGAKSQIVETRLESAQ